MKNSLFYCLALVLIIGCQPLEKNGYISIKNWTNAPITDLKITYISAQKTYSLGTLYPYSEYKYAINYEQHNGVLGILPPNIAKTAAGRASCGFWRPITYRLSAGSHQSIPLNPQVLAIHLSVRMCIYPGG